MKQAIEVKFCARVLHSFLYNLAMMAQRNSEPLRFAVCKFAC